MGRDALENFIDQYRGRFDDEDPRPDVWQSVLSEISTPQQAKVRRLPRGWWMAAAAAGFMLLGVGLGVLWMKPTAGNGFNQMAALQDLEQYYGQEVEGMMDQLVSNPDYEGISQDLQDIDADIEALKDELKEVPLSAKETVLQAIIASYETKVQLLESAQEYSKPFNEREHDGPIHL